MSALDFIEHLPLPVVAALTRPLPPRRRGQVGAWILRRILRNVPSLRRRVVDNLSHVFPDISAARRAEILDGMAASLGRTLVELLHADQFLRRSDGVTWSGNGFEVILAAREAGRPVVGVGGHFGQWEAARAFLKRQGLEAGAIYRPLKNRFSDAFLTPRYSTFGMPLFPKSRAGTRNAVRYLSRGGFLAILADQKIDEGILVDFLGQPAATAPLAAELALKFKAPLVPVYVTRGSDLESFHIEFHDPIPHSGAREMTAAINESLARHVRSHPEQYYWLHRRWHIRNPKHVAELAARQA
ncbi:MAG: lysophospholipid acyltransferase family protein [Pseudomonadota bacterium]